MTKCSCLPVFRARPKIQSSQRRPVDISIYSETHDAWRGALLSCDLDSEDNFVSSELVSTVLNGNPKEIDTKSPPRYILGRKIETYVELRWCLENNKRVTHESRFFVVNEDNAPYDIVLGAADAEMVWK